jgi:hypothetical protein
MVARRFDTKSDSRTPGALLAEVFEMWRRLVSRLRDALLGLRARLSPAEKPAAAPRAWLLRPSVIWLGGVSLALGIGVGIALAPPGLPRSLALWAGVQSALWVIVRGLLMKYASRGKARDLSALAGASSLGLIAYAAAVTPELRAAAWAASAALTWLALVQLGDGRREAGRTVGIAWGAQALVVAGSWIARSAVVAILASRG